MLLSSYIHSKTSVTAAFKHTKKPSCTKQRSCKYTLCKGDKAQTARTRAGRHFNDLKQSCIYCLSNILQLIQHIYPCCNFCILEKYYGVTPLYNLKQKFHYVNKYSYFFQKRMKLRNFLSDKELRQNAAKQ